MDRDQFARPALIALLCIVAIALAAATLTSATVAGGDGGESVLADKSSDTDSPSTTDTNATGDTEFTQPIETSNPLLCGTGGPAIPSSLVLVLLGVSILVVFGVLFEQQWAISLAAPGLVVVMLVVFIALLGCGGLGGSDGSAGEPGATGEVAEAVEDAGPGEVTEDVFSVPQYLVWLLAGSVVLSLFLLLFRAGGDDEDDLLEFLRETTPSNDTTPAAIGRVAGDTVEEIDGNASLENAVYEAWAEMTSELDVDDPETSTPAEFATAAREAGLDSDDVAKLTALFEEVRYGTSAPTAEREQQAIETLEHIERTYSPESASDADGVTAGLFGDTDET